MPVPDTNTFSLEDVRLEIGLAATASLSSCFLNANAGGFDPLYEGSKDRLSNFRNYNHSAGGLTTISLSYDFSTSASACIALPPNNYYSNSANLSAATVLYTDAAGTTSAVAGYYSDQIIWKFWNGSSFTSSGSC